MYIQIALAWDENKNLANQRNHDGISFELALWVFEDENVLIKEDRLQDGEQRFHAIGRVTGLVLLVFHTYIEVQPNEEETIRIISARAASKRELKGYFRQAFD